MNPINPPFVLHTPLDNPTMEPMVRQINVNFQNVYGILGGYLFGGGDDIANSMQTQSTAAALSKRISSLELALATDTQPKRAVAGASTGDVSVEVAMTTQAAVSSLQRRIESLEKLVAQMAAGVSKAYVDQALANLEVKVEMM